MQCRNRGHIYNQLLDVELRGHERLSEPAFHIRTVGQHRLLHDMIKQMLDERVLRVLASGRELRDVARSGQVNSLPVIGGIIAHGVDDPILW